MFLLTYSILFLHRTRWREACSYMHPILLLSTNIYSTQQAICYTYFLLYFYKYFHDLEFSIHFPIISKHSVFSLSNITILVLDGLICCSVLNHLLSIYSQACLISNIYCPWTNSLPTFGLHILYIIFSYSFLILGFCRSHYIMCIFSHT